jgi:hypothetical protein
MTALGVLSLCAARGVKLVLEGGDRITLEGPQAARDEVRETIRSVKPEVLTLLRSQRQAEVSAAFAEAFGRISVLYPDLLAGTLWKRVTTEHPALARAIDVAEQAADAAALAYQQGEAPDSSAFLACLVGWEARWREAIDAVTGDACSDCGRRSVVLVGVDYSAAKFCRACLRPEPLDMRKGARRDA